MLIIEQTKAAVTLQRLNIISTAKIEAIAINKTFIFILNPGKV